jgi:GNAT superfamily N-acetyltransferase
MANDIIIDDFLITKPGKNHWRDISELLSSSIPNALVSNLGPNFGALYYENIAKHHLSCSYAALDKTGRLAGIILGTLDSTKGKQLNFSLKVRLLLAANLRIFSPSVFRWLLMGLHFEGVPKLNAKNLPEAELLIVAVHENFRGRHLVRKLINKLEEFFKENNIEEPYLIRTEKSNQVANRIYEKLGAKYIKTYYYHGKLMNLWQKHLS